MKNQDQNKCMAVDNARPVAKERRSVDGPLGGNDVAFGGVWPPTQDQNAFGRARRAVGLGRRGGIHVASRMRRRANAPTGQARRDGISVVATDAGVLRNPTTKLEWVRVGDVVYTNVQSESVDGQVQQYPKEQWPLTRSVSIGPHNIDFVHVSEGGEVTLFSTNRPMSIHADPQGKRHLVVNPVIVRGDHFYVPDSILSGHHGDVIFIQGTNGSVAFNATLVNNIHHGTEQQVSPRGDGKKADAEVMVIAVVEDATDEEEEVEEPEANSELANFVSQLIKEKLGEPSKVIIVTDVHGNVMVENSTTTITPPRDNTKMGAQVADEPAIEETDVEEAEVEEVEVEETEVVETEHGESDVDEPEDGAPKADAPEADAPEADAPKAVEVIYQVIERPAEKPEPEAVKAPAIIIIEGNNNNGTVEFQNGTKVHVEEHHRRPYDITRRDDAPVIQVNGDNINGTIVFSNGTEIRITGRPRIHGGAIAGRSASEPRAAIIYIAGNNENGTVTFENGTSVTIEGPPKPVHGGAIAGRSVIHLAGSNTNGTVVFTNGTDVHIEGGSKKGPIHADIGGGKTDILYGDGSEVHIVGRAEGSVQQQVEVAEAAPSQDEDDEEVEVIYIGGSNDNGTIVFSNGTKVHISGRDVISSADSCAEDSHPAESQRTVIFVGGGNQNGTVRFSNGTEVHIVQIRPKKHDDHKKRSLHPRKSKYVHGMPGMHVINNEWHGTVPAETQYLPDGTIIEKFSTADGSTTLYHNPDLTTRLVVAPRKWTDAVSDFFAGIFKGKSKAATFNNPPMDVAEWDHLFMPDEDFPLLQVGRYEDEEDDDDDDEYMVVVAKRALPPLDCGQVDTFVEELVRFLTENIKAGELDGKTVIYGTTKDFLELKERLSKIYLGGGTA
jgi:hypothetical protein